MYVFAIVLVLAQRKRQECDYGMCNRYANKLRAKIKGLCCTQLQQIPLIQYEKLQVQRVHKD